MKKELLKSLVIDGVAIGVGIAVAKMISKRTDKKMKELENEQIEAREKEPTNEELLERIEYLEKKAELNRDAINVNYYGIMATLGIFIWVIERYNKNFSHIEEKHNGLLEHLGKMFKHVSDNFDICFDNFAEAEERLGKLEVR